MFVDVCLGQSSSVELHGREDARDLVVRVHGSGGLVELREAMAGASAGVPFGHEAAVDTRWIRAQGTGTETGPWEELIGMLLAAAGRRGQADLDGRWIVGPIVWQGDRETGPPTGPGSSRTSPH